MSRKDFMEAGAPAHRPWWREADVGFLILLVIIAYFVRAGALPIRGEEPTRAQIAREMVAGHDWIVPRQQGDPFLIRPPLQNWLIALSCLGLGTWNEWAVRLPSLLATLATTLLTYGYARTFLGRLGALTAALAFATMADMFQMGRQAETEAVFILLVSASLLVWHGGMTRHWPEFVTWACGYGLMALAMLTKGLQAPLYFVATTCLYLLGTGQLRRIFTLAHLGGLLVGVAVLAAWVVPFYRATGPDAFMVPWFGDAAMAPDWSPWFVLEHLVVFPLEFLPGTLPWSLLLLPLLTRRFRATLGPARDQVLFLAICLGVALPTVWLPTSGLPRFLAPLFPCLAVLIGLVAERCTAAAAVSELRRAWGQYLGAVACTMLAAAVAVLVLTAVPMTSGVWRGLAGPPTLGALYALSAAGLGVVVWRLRQSQDAARARWAVSAVAVFMVLLFTGFLTDVRLRRCVDQPALVRRLKEILPPGQALVSLGGHIDCALPYYYGMPLIAPRSWPEEPCDIDGIDYFCCACHGNERPDLPFAWEELAAISLDRVQLPVPDNVAIIGRRLGAPTALSNSLPATTVSWHSR